MRTIENVSDVKSALGLNVKVSNQLNFNLKLFELSIKSPVLVFPAYGTCVLFLSIKKIYVSL